MKDENRSLLPKEIKTEGGKEFGIWKVANSALYRIGFKGGGEVPKDLKGMWTDPYQAQRAIESYLLNKDKPKPAPKKVEEKATNNAAK